MFAEPFDGYQWTPYSGKVSGELLPTELPKVRGRGRAAWAVARFGIDRKGTIKIKINDTNTMHLFDGKKEIKLPENGSAIVEVTGNKDPRNFTIAINQSARPAPVLIEIVE